MQMKMLSVKGLDRAQVFREGEESGSVLLAVMDLNPDPHLDSRCRGLLGRTVSAAAGREDSTAALRDEPCQSPFERYKAQKGQCTDLGKRTPKVKSHRQGSSVVPKCRSVRRHGCR